METIPHPDSALLLMDMQSAILNPLAGSEAIKVNAAKALDRARQLGLPVIYVVLGFRQGMPEVSADNRSFSTLKESLMLADMNEWSKIDEALAPLPSEIIVQKRRISAFTGSDLEVVLRAKGIRHIILAGVSTGGVVLSTTREAADKDYRITILSDACGDRDEEVHRVLTTKVFPRQAEVVSVDKWIAA